ncbi:protein of unknown function DUF805 (plasmid) [Rhizorhabdus wittichii RW1]|uniref:Tellurite resistance protein TerB n=1 Tax=Rhizorhabdus wittichii (strain DSM 6014 / CCUG 31198 / JCM 15750 / NBRC 105917 / EY 4224 / RW1) TaxID=392499 RepID=A0A9J9LF88_RHIWR|nr:protein of unknown function DUF805 [Rhizorhabdus wittichii RW1]
MPLMFMALRRYRDFSGRASLGEFWSFAGLSAIVFLVLITLLIAGSEPKAGNSAPSVPPGWVFAYITWWLVTAIPWFAVQVRRLHDQGRSGRWVLINVAAYAMMGFGNSFAILLYAFSMLLMLLPGEKRANRFGPVPSSDNKKHETTRLVSVNHASVAEGATFSGTNDVQHVAISPTGANDGHDLSHEKEADMADLAGDLQNLIENRPDGRFACFGYSFSTLDQAVRFAERKVRASDDSLRNARTEPLRVISPPIPDLERFDLQKAPLSPLPASLRLSENSSTSASPDANGIVVNANGRFVFAGYAFSTYDQALKYKDRMTGKASDRTHSMQPESSAQNSDGTAKIAAVVPRLSAAPGPSDGEEPVRLVPLEDENGIIAQADGRFKYGGYSFTTYDQALRYRARLTGTLEHRERPAAIISSLAGRFVPRTSGDQSRASGLSSDARCERQATPCAQWIADATDIRVGDVSLRAEMLYFGAATRSEGHRTLVNPAMAIGRQADSLGTSLSYWPSYDDISPEARRAYLDWLASGRRSPATPIGYVFLYFYGLERRLIHERSQEDAPAILAEVEALLAIYGSNGSFQSYARALIDTAEILFDRPVPPLKASLSTRYSWEIPIGLRVHLGRKVRDGTPIDAEDALCWALAHPNLSTRTAVTRCFEPFRTLWHARYAQAYPKGIKVRSSKSRLHHSYRSASAEFNANVQLDDLPDVGAINGPISKLQSLLDGCTQALDPLSRLLGRSPEEEGSVLASALHPADARGEAEQAAFEGARIQLLSSTSDGSFASIKYDDLLSILLANGQMSADRRSLYARRLPDILDAMDVGYEPDRRFGPAVTFAPDTTLCVFARRGTTQPVEGRQAYRSARIMVEIAVLAAMADSVVVDAEQQSIVTDLAAIAGLDDQDRQRLAAHSIALIANPPKLRAATKRLLELPEEEKDFVLSSAVHAILADQRVTPAEVRFLESLYKALGRPQDDVYTRLHAGSTQGQPRHKSSGQSVGSSVDVERLARLQEETASVSAMLAGIFREDEPEVATPSSPPAVVGEVPLFDGLDIAHGRVLHGLAQEPLEAEAFETLCRDNRLLPGGAIETINDWAFDIFDDLAIEDDDLVSIQPHLVQTIQSMSQAA